MAGREYQEEWYNKAPPDLSDDERKTAASILWALRGDAGQRALMAWSMGWEPARQVSGSEWMVPFLTALMMDPYHAVRFNAQRSLRAYSEFAEVTTDSVTGATKKEQWDMVKRILPHWERTFPKRSEGVPRLLILPDGTIDRDHFKRFTEQRNNQDPVLFE